MVVAETRTAVVEVEETIVAVRVKGGVLQTLPDAQENLALVMAHAGGERRALLIDISKSAPLTPEVRHYYSGEGLVRGFRAMAMLVNATALGRMMGNVYLRIARVGVPTRLFDDEASARSWLGGER